MTTVVPTSEEDPAVSVVRYASGLTWADAGTEEEGGRFRPYSEITGVCHRCKEQIDWQRRYGKYEPLIEPAK